MKAKNDDAGQLTQFMDPTDRIEVAGGACAAPYRCSQCSHSRRQRVPDPERRGQAYSTSACDRPNRMVEIQARDWLDAEVARIGARGRKVEIRAQVLDDGTKTDRLALFAR